MKCLSIGHTCTIQLHLSLGIEFMARSTIGNVCVFHIYMFHFHSQHFMNKYVPPSFSLSFISIFALILVVQLLIFLALNIHIFLYAPCIIILHFLVMFSGNPFSLPLFEPHPHFFYSMTKSC